MQTSFNGLPLVHRLAGVHCAPLSPSDAHCYPSDCLVGSTSSSDDQSRASALMLNVSQCCLPLISVSVGCIGCVRAARFSQQSGVARRHRAMRAAQRTVARARRVTLGGQHYLVGEMLTTPSQDSPGVGECSDLTRVRLLRPVAAPSSEPHMWGLSDGIPLQSHL